MLIILLLLLAAPASAQEFGVSYAGDIYYAPVCNSANCGMDNYIRLELALQKQRNEALAASTGQTIQYTTEQRKQCYKSGRRTYCRMVTVQVPRFVAKEKTTNDYTIETRYRTEQRKYCINGVCTVVNVQVAYKVRVPKAKAKVEAKPTAAPTPTKEPDPQQATPQEVVDFMLALCRPSESDVVLDPGAGEEARFLVTASETYGAQVIGIEIDVTAATKARRLLGRRGIIITGDCGDYSLNAATIVPLFMYNVKAIVPRLRRGTKVVSYLHPIPGVDAQEYKIGEDSVYFGIIQ